MARVFFFDLNMDNGLIKASVAAQQLGKKPITIRRMVRDGRLKGLKNGSRWWVEATSVEQFLQGGGAKTDQNGHSHYSYPEGGLLSILGNLM